ncbi:MAG: hypothetical protein KAI29_16480 [Cyclobacteriaceae bacterium]|nr:hypothetical protein [Cyclobacteriaceae bacterium]
MSHLPEEVLKHPDNSFMTPSEVIDTYDAVDVVDVPRIISWADTERDLSAWLGNAMQSNALHEIYKFEKIIKQTQNEELLADWRRLQTSDHFYYMCTKYWSDGDVHKYFSPYGTPHEAFEGMIKAISQIEYIANRIIRKRGLENYENSNM